MNTSRSILGTGLGILLASSAWAQGTERVSVDSAGNQANGPSWAAFEDRTGLSFDGRYVAFFSEASNLVAGDAAGLVDVFVRDRLTGQTTRVSVDSAGNEANGGSSELCISADGRYVAFNSYASNLVPGDTNGFMDIFVHDRATGETSRVNMTVGGDQANDWSWRPVISADGRYVAFGSVATNLVPNDTNGVEDVFLYDRQARHLSRASVSPTGAQGNDLSGSATISGDGRYLAFVTAASNFVSSDVNLIDIVVKDLVTGAVVLVSKSSGGVQALGQCYQPTISLDGTCVAYVSQATNLVSGDTNGRWDVFVHELATSETTRISVDSSGVQGNHHSWYPYLSGDGRYVAFGSVASNLVPGDTNTFPDTFLHDRWTGGTTRVSVSTAGVQGNSYSGVGAPSGPWWLQLGIAISGDGRLVAFGSEATDLVDGDTNGVCDVFVRGIPGFTLATFCPGDGSEGICPCGNTGAPGRGCDNSASTGGALLLGSGEPRLSADTLVLTSSGERPTSLSLFWQSSSEVAPRVFSDGVGCMGGALKRMYSRNAVGGTVSAPQGPDPSVSARSAALGDPLVEGSMRVYHVFYRDPDPTFCGWPLGSTFNVSSGVRVVWGE